MSSRKLRVTLVAVIALSFSGYVGSVVSSTAPDASEVASVAVTSEAATTADAAATTTGTDTASATAGTTAATATDAAPAPTEWSLDAYPDYVRVVAEPVTIDEDVDAGTILFSSLDSLGRSGRAVGRITHQMVEDSSGWRADFASDVDQRLSGWGHNGKVTISFADGTSYNGYLWNRSHLIADTLGGYDVETRETPVENLVTGTRTQNVGRNDGNGGMAYFETRTVTYLDAHPDVTVWYSATPLYEGDEVVCRSVYVEALSSDGGLDLQGEVFNCANGYQIDYATGTFESAS